MERRAITVQGVVQGVGFRPFVHGLAARLQLRGFVQNRTGEVVIEVEGERNALDLFMTELTGQAPPLARIEHLGWSSKTPNGDCEFRIKPSVGEFGSPTAIFVSPDVATCDDCLRELFDPSDRRYCYPFLNCTNCGPRLTIVTRVPYDRCNTTMAAFPMCPECRSEYDDPRNRRFHAQPTCCRRCGPQLQPFDAAGKAVDAADPISWFAQALKRGQIGALKGLGGFHLVCDARSAAVAELRRRKHRDEKPFAVMVRDACAARGHCKLDEAELALLTSARRPITLLRKWPGTEIAEAVAPGNPYLGLMLPYTPLHHLLLAAMGGVPLVMTSGNRADEPIAYENADALRRLRGIAEVFLMHNRPIHVRCDDSVTRVGTPSTRSRSETGVAESPLRRSRGEAPLPVALPWECRHPILAVGGQFKGTFALGRGRHGFLSHHLGDLDHFEAFRAFERDIALYQQLLDIEPAVIAHDLHPDYASTRYARDRANAKTDLLRLVAVQHHHAHMASAMAEHGLNEPVIGVAFDGTGYGTDGAIWGGEFLSGDYLGFQRAAHFRYVGLAGGDRAVREPWRTGLAHLVDAGCDLSLLERRTNPEAFRTVRKMLERKVNTPQTSSVGRLFDAVSALAGVRDRVSYEGQAAMELEWLAADVPVNGAYPFEIAASPDAPLQVDTRPLIRAVLADVERGSGSAVVGRRFHSTLAEIITVVGERLRQTTRLNKIVLSGGVFMNQLLAADVNQRLAAGGFEVFQHRRVPPNDGGLSLGQLAVAAAMDVGR